MVYLRTIAVAIGLCTIVLVIRSATNVVLPTLQGEATGVAFSRQSLIEVVRVAFILGWVSGTLWYGVRRFMLRIR